MLREMTDNSMRTFRLICGLPLIAGIIGCSGTDERLHRAVILGDMQAVVRFVESGDKINACGKYGRTPLYYAALTGHDEILLYLLRCGADPNKGASWKGGDTPMHVAAERGDADALRIMIANGGIVDAINYAKQTPMAKAAHHRNVQAVKLLVHEGAKINAEDRMGNTPLSYPSGFVDGFKSNYCEIVKYLVEHGAEINHVDHNGETALHEAIFMGDECVVTFLLQRGADPRIRGIRGTPREWAWQHGRTNLCVLIDEYTRP